MRPFDRAIMRALLKVPARDSAPADEVIEDGGKGSGNFGHKGRPGLRGGSGAGGGKAFRTEENGGYVGVTKSSKFSGIAQNARDYSDYRSFVKSLTPVQRETIQAQHKTCGTQETLSQYTERLHTMLQKVKQPNVDKPEHHIVNGRDMLGEWKRRKDQFEFEINDAMNAQGFDGLPRVVSKKEFDEAVKAANGGKGFIAQRAYTAPNKETADQYRDQLYHGEWYVNCEVGGAQYGQGMYCAADYTGTLSNGIKTEMSHYENVGDDRNREIARMEAEEKVWEDALKDATDLEKCLVKREYRRNATNQERAYAKQWEKNNPAEYYAAVDKFKKYADAALDASLAAAPTCYVETLTLAPDAKIAKYSELQKEFREYESQFSYETVMPKCLDKIATWAVQNHGLTGRDKKEIEEMLYLYANGHTKKQMDRYDELKAKYGYGTFGDDPLKSVSALHDEVIHSYNLLKSRQTAYDIGTYAVLRGYDAINAENHGASGSYTVILNRTKCIFLEP